MELSRDRRTDLHVALPPELVAGLDGEARRRGMRRVQLLREVVSDYLVRAEAERVAGEMRAYAEALGDASAEFVAATEAHTVERLLRETEW